MDRLSCQKRCDNSPIDAVAKWLGVRVYETPVGLSISGIDGSEKYCREKKSGGLSITGHILKKTVFLLFIDG
jgi:hypothetical protein